MEGPLNPRIPIKNYKCEWNIDITQNQFLLPLFQIVDYHSMHFLWFFMILILSLSKDALKSMYKPEKYVQTLKVKTRILIILILL